MPDQKILNNMGGTNSFVRYSIQSFPSGNANRVRRTNGGTACGLLAKSSETFAHSGCLEKGTTMIKTIQRWLQAFKFRPLPSPVQSIPPLPVLLKLGRHYLHDGRILHASDRLLGVASAVSVGVPPTIAQDGVVQAQTSFVLCDELFTITVELARFHGPLRGHRRIDVYRNGERIFFEERGSKGFGSNYSCGSTIFVERDRAYELVAGHELCDRAMGLFAWDDLDPNSLYLLRYENFVVPQQCPPAANLPPLQKTCFSRRDLLSRRQVVWKAQMADSPLGSINVSHSEVAGFYLDGRTNTGFRYYQNKWFSCLHRTEIAIGEQVFVFE
ncbi:MAG: hypothetical protein EOP50_12910 [Sphingobacteriales bacterium]|nr:MAG: hypothetical protein EOP50_12910 [Sphingobacteriales bacterium]